MSEKEGIVKLHGKKMQKFNAKSCMSLFLCAVLLFTSIDYAQVQAEEATSKDASVQELSDSAVQNENITENPVNPNGKTENANDAESGKGSGSGMDTGNEKIPGTTGSTGTGNEGPSGTADGTYTGNKEAPGTSDGTDTENKKEPGTSDGTDTVNKENQETSDGTDTENKEDQGTSDDTENTDNPVKDDDSDKKDESDSNDDDKNNDDKNSENSGNSSETEDTENPENPDETNEDGEDEGNTPTENPDESDKNDGNKDKDDSSKEGEGTDEIQFVKTAEGAIIISSFEQLQETDSKIVLDKKLPLDELTAMMPQTLKAYAYAYATTENKADEASSPDTEPAAKIQKKISNAMAALTKGKTGNETAASTNDKTEGETASPTNDNSGSENAAPTNDNSGSENAAPTNDNSSSENAATTNDNSGSENAAPTNDNSGSENAAPTKAETNTDIPAQTDEKETSLRELEIPIRWECNEDYNNTELESYDFTPSWDNAAYYYEAAESTNRETNEEADAEPNKETNEEPAALPTITVIFDKNATADTVSTQEELEEAFASGTSKIVLAEDIALTKTLTLPASADTLLDGQGFSLTRGTDENGVFIGTMIYMGGDGYTKKDYGKLTLTDICIDGKTPNNRAGSSTIIDYGSLTLDKDAYIKNNSSYGTYEYDDNGKLQTLVDDFGGGVQVYGELKVTERALVTGNFADEFGGGVYLADKSVLYLYADVIKENSVAKGTGYGADLYAANGSTIYYDSSIDMEREGFYICPGVELICMDEMDEEAETALFDEEDRHDEKVEFYVSVANGSGYNLEEIESKLAALGPQYSVVSKRTDIDITDSKNWYVYDHYDRNTNCWDDLTTDIDSNGRPDAWEAYYDYNPNRGYYPIKESYIYTGYTITKYKYNEDGSLAKDEDGNYIIESSTRYPVENPAYTIAEWLNNSEYIYGNLPRLSAFKEHIYQGKQGGHPMMTFVGYGNPAYVDFMFYDPQSTGEKVVDFDVNSSKVNTHTLTGAGFLVNTAEKVNDEGKLLLDGYLVYYDYAHSSGTYPSSVSIYYLDGINAKDFHNGIYDLKDDVVKKNILGSPLKDSRTGKDAHNINSSNWTNEMSVQIKVTTNSIEVRQQPKNTSTSIALSEPVLQIQTPESAYSGFGPLVAYTSKGHTCDQASSFTYSNLSMYYTNPIHEGQSILQALEKADYTQEGTQKYFINLFGDSNLDYNNAGVESWMYQDFLKLMQIEGVALITDRDTPFAENLGESGKAGSNLCEIKKGVTVDELVNLIKEYVEQEQQTTTYMQNKLQSDEKPDGLTNATPSQPVGNCWLKAASGKEQVRTIWGDSLIDVGYTVQIIDDISYYHDASNVTGVTYEILKPGESAYTTVSTTTPSETASFVIKNDKSAWPAGQYTVRQTIHTSNGDAKVDGYAYFEVKRNDDIGDTENPGHTHTWSNWTVDTAPTCTTAGLQSRHCLTCNETQEEPIPAAGHKPNDEFGHDETGHWHNCVICSEKLNISPHEFGGWIHDNDKHWHECICDYIADEAEHKFEEWGYNAASHWRGCICGARTEAVEHEFGEWVHDNDKHWHWRECVCGTRTDEAEHKFEEWSYNETSHWQECICGVKTEAEIHEGAWITDKTATEDEEGSKHRICDSCKYREDLPIERLPHVHIYGDWLSNETSHWRECIKHDNRTDEAIHDFGEWAIDTPATEDEEGSRHRICATCDYREDEIIPLIPHEHQFGDWVHNETSHWRECRCNEKTDEAAHNFGEWIIDNYASEDADGLKHRKCSVCEYIEQDVIKLGNVTKREDCGEKAPRTVISTELRAVVSATFENEDIQEVKSGKDVDIILTVDDAGDTVSASDQTAITSVMGSYKLGQYLDVNLYKEINNNKAWITETKNDIRLVLDVPETLKKTNSRLPRSFVIIRVHDGNAVILNDLDSNDNTITVDTDLFSTYAIVYADKKSGKRTKPANADNSPEGNQLIDTFIEFITVSPPPAAKKDAEPKTGNNSHIELYATIALIEGLSYLTYLFTFKYGMTEEKKNELIARLIEWAKHGGRLRRVIAIASIFMLLVYYHSIGKHTNIEWTQVYD